MKDVVVETVGWTRAQQFQSHLVACGHLYGPDLGICSLGVRSSFPSMVSDPLVVGSLHDPS